MLTKIIFGAAALILSVSAMACGKNGNVYVREVEVGAEDKNGQLTVFVVNINSCSMISEEDLKGIFREFYRKNGYEGVNIAALEKAFAKKWGFLGASIELVPGEDNEEALSAPDCERPVSNNFTVRGKIKTGEIVTVSVEASYCEERKADKEFAEAVKYFLGQYERKGDIGKFLKNDLESGMGMRFAEYRQQTY